MIHDVDGSLRSLLARSFPDGAPTVAFDAPTPEWAEAQHEPALSFFLYDIREDLDGRAADWDDVRDERGRVIGRQPPPRRYQLSYLVTAWAKSPEDEHRLISGVLSSVPERELIPDEDLQGSLAGVASPVLVRVGIPQAGAGVQGWELLSALGVRPRACVELVVLAPLFAPMVTDIAPPADEISLGLSREDGGVKQERGFPYPPAPKPEVPLEEREAAAAAAAAERDAKTAKSGADKAGSGGRRTGKVTEPEAKPAADSQRPPGGGHGWSKVRITEKVHKPDEPLEG